MVFGQLLALAWWVGGGWRLYQLARFFQIEEYKSNRFFQWATTSPGERRYLLKNIFVFAAFDLLCALLGRTNQNTTDVSTRQTLATIVLLLAFVVLAGVVFRLPEREIKRPLARTPRAIRLLIAAFIVQGVLLLAILLPLPLAAPPFTPFSIAAGGFVAFLLTPLVLAVANMLTYPLEATIRQGYVRNARAALDRTQAKVIAITGSYGKTSTKEYIAHLLDGRYRVFKTPKSYNTLMGVCKAINQTMPRDQQFDYLIVEAGAYMPGEIAAICRLTRPTISLVTAVGPMHLERFGSLERTAQAKYEIIKALPPDGAAVFNDDDPLVLAMDMRGYPATRLGITRQDAPMARFSAHKITMTIDGLDFDVSDSQTGETGHIHAPLYGEHNVSNILMALAVGRQVGIPLADLIRRAVSLAPAEHRLVRRVLPNGVITIDDAYSANPIGSRQALAVLALNKKKQGRRIVLSSGMVELGPIQDEENRKLGAAIAQVATDVILINARLTLPLQKGLYQAKFPQAHLQIVETTGEAVAAMNSLAKAGDAVLIMADLPDTY